MKHLTLVRYIWDSILFAAVIYLVFFLLGPAILFMTRAAFRSSIGVDLGFLRGVFNYTAMLVALLGIAIAISSNFGGRLSRIQRVYLGCCILIPVILTIADGLVASYMFRKIRVLVDESGPRLMDFINDSTIPTLILLCLFVLAQSRRRGPWLTLLEVYRHFRPTRKSHHVD